MTGVTFKAWDGDRYLGLGEVLAALSDLVEDVRWRVRIDEAAGNGLTRLEALTQDSWLDTPSLLSATRDVQLIDGRLTGYRTGDPDTPYLSIHAVDSTWWDVESSDDVVAEAIMGRFPQVRQLPSGRQ